MTEPRARDTPLSFVVGLNLYLAAIYTNLAVAFGGFLIPGALGLIGALFLLRSIRNLQSLIWIVLFLTASLLAGGSGAEMIGYRLPSWIQIVAALACAHILLCGIDYRVMLRKTLFAWMLFIAIGVAAEATLPAVHQLSDSFRVWAYDGRFIYSDDMRDLGEYGRVRPKLFTQEPSHISKSLIVFGAGWYLLARGRSKRFWWLLSCVVVTTVFLRSPFVLLAVPMAWLLDRSASGKRLPAAGIPVAVTAAGLVALQVFSARFESIQSGRDLSFVSRYQAPFEVTSRVLERHPLFGVGIGAKEALWDDMAAALGPFFSASYLRKVYLDHFNNAFANSLMFFGVVGAIIFYILVARWAKSFGVPTFAALLVVLVFFQLDGALEGIRMWSSVALIWGCYILSRRLADYGGPEGAAGGIGRCRPVVVGPYGDRVGRRDPRRVGDTIRYGSGRNP